MKQAVTAVGRLLDAAGGEIGQKEAMLEAAGQLLCYLNHYLPDDPKVEVLSSRLRELGGSQPEYRPITPLSEMYHRPEAGLGCGSLIGGLLVLALACCGAVCALLL